MSGCVTLAIALAPAAATASETLATGEAAEGGDVVGTLPVDPAAPQPSPAPPPAGEPSPDPPSTDPPAGQPPSNDPPAEPPPSSDPPAGQPPSNDPPAEPPPSSDPHAEPPPADPARRDPAPADPPATEPAHRASPPAERLAPGPGPADSPTARPPMSPDAKELTAAMPTRQQRRQKPPVAAHSPRPGEVPIDRPLAAPGSGWLTPAGSATLAWHAASPSTSAHANAEKDRAAPVKTARERHGMQDDAPRPGGSTHNVGATAAACGGVAPPATFCAIFARTPTLDAHELRRLHTRLLVPDAPGVPSLRDRPG